MPETLPDTPEITIKVEKNNQTIEVPLEDYIIGVVAGEMPATFQEEALKAQAIASRTYVINHLTNNHSITASTSDQVYLTITEQEAKWQSNFSKYYSKIKQAVSATENQIMYYNNLPIKAYYYSQSNGYTEDSLNVFGESLDYLKSVISPWESSSSQTTTISKLEFCTSLQITCNNIEITNRLEDKSHRVSQIDINGQTFTGIEVRQKLGLRSTDFTIEESGENINITTSGYGHGVGMSQYGANAMALQGFNYEQILKYYYQNIEIANI